MTPEEQLANIRNVVKSDPDALPLAVDVELYKGQSASNLQKLAKEGACADRLGPNGIQLDIASLLDGIGTTYGKKPVLYGNSYLLDQVLGQLFTSGRKLWKTKFGVRHAPTPPWTIWQFTQNESVDGIQGAVDMNILSK